MGTQLTPQQEKKYQSWRAKLPKNLQYEGDYDLRGLYLSNPDVKPTSNLHFPDTYKLPNHPTFSNESVYFQPYGAISPNIDSAGYWQDQMYIPYNPQVKDTIIEKKQKGGKISKQKADSRYKALYGPVENRLNNIINKIGFDNLPLNTQEMITNTIGQFDNTKQSNGSPRYIPPVDDVIRSGQKQFNALTDKQLESFLKTDWSEVKSLPQFLKVIPDGVGLLDAYKYYNEYNKLKQQGYTFENGGTIHNNMAKKKRGATVTYYDQNGNVVENNTPQTYAEFQRLGEPTPAYRGDVALQIGVPNSSETRGIGTYQAPPPPQPISATYNPPTQPTPTPIQDTPKSVSFQPVITSLGQRMFVPQFTGNWGSPQVVRSYLNDRIPDSYGGIPVEKSEFQIAPQQMLDLQNQRTFNPFFQNGGALPPVPTSDNTRVQQPVQISPDLMGFQPQFFTPDYQQQYQGQTVIWPGGTSQDSTNYRNGMLDAMSATPQVTDNMPYISGFGEGTQKANAVIPQAQDNLHKAAKNVKKGKMEDGGSLTPEKAKKILRDGEIKGKPLTPAQKRYFGFIAGGGTPDKADDGIHIDPKNRYLFKPYIKNNEILEGDFSVPEISKEDIKYLNDNGYEVEYL